MENLEMVTNKRFYLDNNNNNDSFWELSVLICGSFYPIHDMSHQWAPGTLQCFADGLFLLHSSTKQRGLLHRHRELEPSLSGETPRNSEEKINGINKSHLVDGRPRVRPLISLLLKLPFNVLCDATREKCRVNGCHAPAADITFFFFFFSLRRKI